MSSALDMTDFWFSWAPPIQSWHIYEWCTAWIQGPSQYSTQLRIVKGRSRRWSLTSSLYLRFPKFHDPNWPFLKSNFLSNSFEEGHAFSLWLWCQVLMVPRLWGRHKTQNQRERFLSPWDILKFLFQERKGQGEICVNVSQCSISL